jgi:hypothetical protein
MAPKKNEELSIEEMRAQLDALRAEYEAAKDEAMKLVEEARKAAGAKSAEEEAKAKEAAERAAYMEEYVEVKLFKDNEKYKDDVFVSVNGENCVIKRGERVKIKRKFAEVLDHSEHQDYETSKMIEAATQTKKLADL